MLHYCTGKTEFIQQYSAAKNVFCFYKLNLFVSSYLNVSSLEILNGEMSMDELLEKQSKAQCTL